MDPSTVQMADGNLTDNVIPADPTEHYYNYNETSDYYWIAEDLSPGLYTFTKYLTVYVQPILFGFGILGNLVSFVVFLSKSMRRISSNVYLAALSASSFGFNLILLLQWLEMVNLPIIHVQGICQTLVYFSYVFGFQSVWFIVCVTMENYIVTFHLQKAVKYCTVKRARIVVGVFFMFSVVIYSGNFWATGVVNMGNNTSMCTEIPIFSGLNQIYLYWDTLTTLLLPFLVTSVLIVAILYKNACIGRPRHTPLGIPPISRRLSNTQKSLLKITRVLLAISLTFVVLSCPSHANKIRLLVAHALGNQQIYTLFDRVLLQIFQIVYYASFSFNVVLYIMWSNNFRRGCKQLVFCSRQSHAKILFRNLERCRDK